MSIASTGTPPTLSDASLGSSRMRGSSPALQLPNVSTQSSSEIDGATLEMQPRALGTVSSSRCGTTAGAMAQSASWLCTTTALSIAETSGEASTNALTVAAPWTFTVSLHRSSHHRVSSSVRTALCLESPAPTTHRSASLVESMGSSALLGAPSTHTTDAYTRALRDTAAKARLGAAGEKLSTCATASPQRHARSCGPLQSLSQYAVSWRSS